MNPCTFSPCRRYRYTLVHEWDATLPRVMWIGLNPSTADENQLDPTLTRIRGFSQRMGYGSFVMCNLYAWRDTDPRGLLTTPDPEGPDNMRHIYGTMADVAAVVCAWGQPGPKLITGSIYASMARLAGMTPLCLGVNQSGARKGHPKHPLYLPASAELRVYTPAP